jgi:hypothetical protein
MAKQVPYYIQAELAKDGYTSMADLADRWTNKEKVRELAPADYDFKSDSDGFDGKTSLRSAIRLAQAVEHAQSTCFGIQQQLALGSTSDASVTLLQGQRTTLEEHYANKIRGDKPSLADQGSDHYLGLQYKACAKGEIGYFTNKQIISYLPDRHEMTNTRKKRRVDRGGVPHEYDEAERQDPMNMEAWKRQTTIFRTSLLMCV